MLMLSPQSIQADPTWAIERYSFFHGTLHICGFVFSRSSKVMSLMLNLGGGGSIAISRFGLPSPDLTRQHGRDAASCRFDQVLQVGIEAPSVLTASLTVILADGRTYEIPLAASDPSDPSAKIMDRFFARLAQRPPGHLLEVGSRARTGTTYTSRLPPGWRYTGFDIMDGPNVNVVGDAHYASRFLPRNTYDAVMSFVVFEHLLMPWKAVIEINRVLRTGAIGLVLAPQNWPLHEEPCDYFRFSKHSWKALFNRATGFEIIEADHGAIAYVVPRHLTPGNNFGDIHITALMASVIFRKIGETTLDWPVEASDIVQDTYPL